MNTIKKALPNNKILYGGSVNENNTEILLENKSTYARVKAKHFFIESLRFYGDKIIKNNEKDKH